MMLLVMSREVLGDVAFAKVLAKLFETRRGTTAAWADVRAAVSAASADAKALFDRWDAPGVPALAVASQSKKSGSKWTVTGKVSQPGTAEPRPMRVRVVATCGKKAFEATVNLTAGEAPFTIAVPSEPESVVADPEFLVLATRASASGIDAEKVLAEAFAVVNSPADDDPAHCAKAMSQLRSLLDSGDDRYAGQCHVGIGRLLFRTGKLDEAKSELETALKMGGFGPFHRSWTLFRLGCISDVQKRRDDAVARYKAVIELKGANEFVVKRAKQFVEKAYRGYGEDG
jgi:tetratricopeptide (TPR) repeat protein